MTGIKSMKLYTHVERIQNELLELGKGAGEPLGVDELSALDRFPERPRHVRVLGEATVQALDDFYSAVDHHFYSGKLGGLRLCARRRDEP